MSKEFKRQTVSNAEFELPTGKSLVVNLNSPLGIDRLVVKTNEDGTVKVRVTGHSKFSFEQKGPKADENRADFLLTNPSVEIRLEDLLLGKFWGQFAFGQLSILRRDKKLAKLLDKLTKKLVKEFESKAAEQMNNLPQIKKIRRDIP